MTHVTHIGVQTRRHRFRTFVDVGTITNANTINFPIVVLWLVLGACFFTLRMNFINLRGFTHAIFVTRGDYDNPDDPGEITHFKALSSALSATVAHGTSRGRVGSARRGACFGGA